MSTDITRIKRLLAAGQGEEALSVLQTRPMQSADIRMLKSAALDAVGDWETANRLNLSLMSDVSHRGWALAAEAARYAVSGNRARAVTCFNMALNTGQIGSPQGRTAYFSNGAQTNPLQGHTYYDGDWDGALSCDWLYKRYPHLKQHHEVISQAFAEAFQRMSAAGLTLYQTDPVFGPAAQGLTGAIEAAIEGMLTAKWAAFDKGEMAGPSLLARYRAARTVCGERAVLFALDGFVRRDGSRYESEPARRFLETAIEAGCKATLFETDVMYDAAMADDQAAFNTAVEGLRQAVAAMKPDILFMEAHSYGQKIRWISAPYLQHLKRIYGFKLVVFASDVNDYFPIDLDAWQGTADLIVGGPVCSVHHNPFDNAPGFLQSVAVPLTRDYLRSCEQTERDIGFSFAGNSHSHRSRLIKALSGVTDQVYLNLNNKIPRPDPLSYVDYHALLRRTRMMVNFGRISEAETLKGRTIEAIASGVLNFEFHDSLVPRMYLPYIHYIPFSNLDQLVQFGRFFEKHRAWRDKIAGQGRLFHLENYDGVRFWQLIFKTLETDQSALR